MEKQECQQLTRIIDLTEKIARITRKKRNVLIPDIVARLNKAGFKSRYGHDYTYSIVQNIYSGRTEPDQYIELILIEYLAEVTGKRDLVDQTLKSAYIMLCA